MAHLLPKDSSGPVAAGGGSSPGGGRPNGPSQTIAEAKARDVDASTAPLVLARKNEDGSVTVGNVKYAPAPFDEETGLATVGGSDGTVITLCREDDGSVQVVSVHAVTGGTTVVKRPGEPTGAGPAIMATKSSMGRRLHRIAAAILLSGALCGAGPAAPSNLGKMAPERAGLEQHNAKSSAPTKKASSLAEAACGDIDAFFSGKPSLYRSLAINWKTSAVSPEDLATLAGAAVPGLQRIDRVGSLTVQLDLSKDDSIIHFVVLESAADPRSPIYVPLHPSTFLNHFLGGDPLRVIDTESPVDDRTAALFHISPGTRAAIASWLGLMDYLNGRGNAAMISPGFQALPAQVPSSRPADLSGVWLVRSDSNYKYYVVRNRESGAMAGFELIDGSWATPINCPKVRGAK